MKENVTLIISLYAAFISTLVLIWRIYEYYNDRRGKFIIKLKKKEEGKPIRIKDIPESAKLIPEDLPDYDFDFKKIVEIEILNAGKRKDQLLIFQELQLNKMGQSMDYISIQQQWQKIIH